MFNKVTLPGATNRVLLLESPQEADAGIYAVIGDDDAAQLYLHQWPQHETQWNLPSF